MEDEGLEEAKLQILEMARTDDGTSIQVVLAVPADAGAWFPHTISIGKPFPADDDIPRIARHFAAKDMAAAAKATSHCLLDDDVVDGLRPTHPAT